MGNYLPTWALRLALLCPVALGLIGCRASKEVSYEKLPNQNSRKILQAVKDSALHYQALSAKVSADMDSPQRSGKFKLNLRMKSDSAIWISTTAALGIEVLRAVISKDSLKYIDRIHNTYFAGSIHDLESRTGLPLIYNSMERLLLGNLVDLDDVDRFKVSQDKALYMLTSKAPRKLRKAVGLKRKEELIPSTDSAFADVVKKRKLRKARHKFGEQTLVLEQYWVDPDHYRVRKLLINDVRDQSTLEVRYPEYQKFNNRYFPQTLILNLTHNGKHNRIELEFKRIRSEDRAINMPFNIPEKYELAE